MYLHTHPVCRGTCSSHTGALHKNSSKTRQPGGFLLHARGNTLSCLGYSEWNRCSAPLPLLSCPSVPWCLRPWGWPAPLQLPSLPALDSVGPSRPACVVVATAEGRGLHASASLGVGPGLRAALGHGRGLGHPSRTIWQYRHTERAVLSVTCALFPTPSVGTSALPWVSRSCQVHLVNLSAHPSRLLLKQALTTPLLSSSCSVSWSSR